MSVCSFELRLCGLEFNFIPVYLSALISFSRIKLLLMQIQRFLLFSRALLVVFESPNIVTFEEIWIICLMVESWIPIPLNICQSTACSQLA